MEIADDGDAVVPVDPLQRVHDDAGVARVERRDGLVGEDDARLLHQGTGDGDALLLAAGEALGALGGEPAMSNCSRADRAMALSSALHSFRSERA